MNTADISDSIAQGYALPKSKARQIVDSVLAAIAEAAAKGEEVSLPSFGKFKVADRPARTGRNPRTGDPMNIAASKKLTFSAAKALKDRLNG